MVTALPVLMHAVGIQHFSMQTVMMVMVVGIERRLAKDI
jgi:hypothetical protein